MLTQTFTKTLIISCTAMILVACDDDDVSESVQSTFESNSVAAPSLVDGDSSASQSIIDIARAQDNEFTSLVAALEATGLDATLNDLNTQFTVFAPTDAAFAKLGEDTLNNLFSDTETLENILLYHVIAGSEIKSAQVLENAGDVIQTANGQQVAVSLSGDNLLTNLSSIINTDIDTDNGVIHVIDTVLLPPADAEITRLPTNIVETAVADSRLSTLVTALQAAGLDEDLSGDGPFTVFAPTNAAFQALPEGVLEALLADIHALSVILKLHVVAGSELSSVQAYAANGSSIPTLASTSGQELTVSVGIEGGVLSVGGAKVTITDIYTSNGVVHLLDSVIRGE